MQSGVQPDIELVRCDRRQPASQPMHADLAFGAPTDDRAERTLWIDTNFRVSTRDGTEAEAAPLARLEPLVALIVREPRADRDELVLAFDDGTRLTASPEPGSDGWWMTPPSD
jgi:hypothetical protein